jgi:hypothetical protein
LASPDHGVADGSGPRCTRAGSADEERFLLDFLPFEMRKVRREGIELFHVFTGMALCPAPREQRS